MQAGIVLTSYGSALDPWNGPGPPSSPDIAVLEKICWIMIQIL
jgi:hypothetical protein